MKILVGGSSHFADYKLLKTTLLNLTRKLKRIEIVVGGGEGAEKLAENWALNEAWKTFGVRNVNVTIFHAEWKLRGKKTGPPHNQDEMIDYMDGKGAVVLFWDLESQGTERLLKKARERHLKVKIVPFDSEE